MVRYERSINVWFCEREKNHEIVHLDGLYFLFKVARIKEGSAPGQVLLQGKVREYWFRREGVKFPKSKV